MKFSIFNFQFSMVRGFTLIEIMTAISVFSIGILGIYGLVPMGITAGVESTDRFAASQLGLEGMEIIRNIRDNNWLEQAADPNNSWDEGLTGCASGCEADYTVLAAAEPILSPYGSGSYFKVDGSGFFNYTNGTSTNKFKRKIVITPDTNILDVRVTVEWSKKYPALILQEKFYDWR